MLAEGDLVEGVQKGGICLDDFPILTLPFGPRTELGPLPPAPSQLGLLRGPRAGPLVGVAVLLKQNPSLHPNWPLPGPSSSLQVGPGVGASWRVTRAAVGLGDCESGGGESCERRRALDGGLSVQPWARMCVREHEGVCARGVRACAGCV